MSDLEGGLAEEEVYICLYLLYLIFVTYFGALLKIRPRIRADKRAPELAFGL